MKLIKVEFIEECSSAYFFNVTLEVKRTFKKAFQVTRRAYLTKWQTNNGYCTTYNWADTGSYGQLQDTVVSEMILQYEKTNQNNGN